MPNHCLLHVRVTPRSGKDEITGYKEGVLLVRLKAPPVDGAANAALERFLADKLAIAKSAVMVLRGQTSRSKVVEITGFSEAEAIAHLDLEHTNKAAVSDKGKR